MPTLHYAIQTRFVDVDGFGHVNNAAFFSYLENAREELYRTDEALSGSFGTSRFVLVSHQEIEYRSPLRFSAEAVSVAAWVARIGRSSFDLNYRVCSGDGRVEYAIANTGMVVTYPVDGRPTALSDSERVALERFSGEPVSFRA